MRCSHNLWPISVILQTTNKNKICIWCVEKNGHSELPHSGTAGEKKKKAIDFLGLSTKLGFVIPCNYADTIHGYLRKVHVERGYIVCEIQAKWLQELTIIKRCGICCRNSTGLLLLLKQVSTEIVEITLPHSKFSLVGRCRKYMSISVCVFYFVPMGVCLSLTCFREVFPMYLNTSSICTGEPFP